MEKTSFKIFIGALVISLLIFAGLFIYSLNIKDNSKIEVQYVTNPTMFFTVENCINKYISYVAEQNSEAVYSVIDEEYKKQNGITINNTLANSIQLSSNNYSFVSQAMLEDKNVAYQYYVRGLLVEEIYGDENFEGEKREYGLIVKLDVENNTYSIIPSEVGEYFDAI